ncbi:peptide/nickel transport system permease protein [Pacificibacter maritimus]|uniref:Peptide/nickel transport system permease protein n=1 Tax=Pacificibacter maritimus TaxID=762213 RepID=A0A3N4UUU9_9RHOB|nr:ABC transporter permease [Pacificibacter maritimus]RPE71361.1 peptide/nickel transport system permease protein [Pacificibacter maritimus]
MSDHITDPASHAHDFEMNAEVATGPSLSYWQLVRKRFARNRTGVIGAIICCAIIFTALCAPFLAPYTPATKDRSAIYTPPQMPRFIAQDGGLTRPYVLGFAEEMHPVTYEITFQPSPEKRVDLALFVQGPEYQFLGMNFTTHFIGGAKGAPVHFLGTDGLGRDVFSRMLYGSRITLLMGMIVMGMACVIGTLVGVTSGYLGGRTDTVIQRVIEFVKSFPDLPLYLALVAVLPRRADPMLTFVMFAAIVVVLKWADLARELRGKVIAIRSVEFVRAAVAVGASDKRIIGRHIIPNMSSHIIVWATYVLPEVILLESFLSFLGVGIQQPMVSWGVMLNAVRDFQSLASAPWLLAPVGMIILSVLAFNALGDGLRDAMDPYSHD